MGRFILVLRIRTINQTAVSGDTAGQVSRNGLRLERAPSSDDYTCICL